MESNIFKFLKSKVVAIFVSSILLAVIFFSMSFLFSSLYKADVYCYSNVFENVHNESVFSSFNTLLSTGNTEDIHEMTNMDIEVIENLEQVDFFDIASSKNNYFKISIVSKSKDYMMEILNGVIFYYENTGINKELLILENQKNQSLVMNKTKSIFKIDSMYNAINSNSNLLIESDFELSKNIIADELEIEKINLVTGNGLNIINMPFAPKNPYFPNKILFLIFGFLIGSIVSLLYFLLKFELKNN